MKLIGRGYGGSRVGWWCLGEQGLYENLFQGNFFFNFNDLSYFQIEQKIIILIYFKKANLHIGAVFFEHCHTTCDPSVSAPEINSQRKACFEWLHIFVCFYLNFFVIFGNYCYTRSCFFFLLELGNSWANKTITEIRTFRPGLHLFLFCSCFVQYGVKGG